MRRRIELIVFLLFAVVLLILAMTVQTGAEEAAVPAQSIEMPAEDPLEGAKIDAALDWHYIEDCTLTAYCACSECCGEWADGITASGVPVQEGVTVAVDPDVIPLGAWVEINGHQYHAEDTGGFCGNHVDIYFESHDEALQFGVRNESVRWYFG